MNRFTRLSTTLLTTYRPLLSSVKPHFRSSIQNNARAYSSEPSAKPKSRRLLATLAIFGIGAGAGYFLYSPPKNCHKNKCPVAAASEAVDYEKVYKAVADALEDDYEDGSYGPVFVRLAWHASGTYSKIDGTGGSNGATMRFAPESNHGANAGLFIARDRLENVKKQFPNISYGDLWTLAGVCAIQEMGGPIIKWRPGRKDVEDGSVCAPDGRLPDAALKQDHIRDIFYRMGFNDREIVALIGAHALGRCHPDRSGFEGPWTPSPTMFTNDFFVQLLEKKWVKKNWKGPQQMVDKETGELMMLPADMALAEDKEFRKYVEEYAKDSDKFFNDFAAVFQKLLELGVKFEPETKERTFKPVNA